MQTLTTPALKSFIINIDVFSNFACFAWAKKKVACAKILKIDHCLFGLLNSASPSIDLTYWFVDAKSKNQVWSCFTKPARQCTWDSLFMCFCISWSCRPELAVHTGSICMQMTSWRNRCCFQIQSRHCQIFPKKSDVEMPLTHRLVIHDSKATRSNFRIIWQGNACLSVWLTDLLINYTV